MGQVCPVDDVNTMVWLRQRLKMQRLARRETCTVAAARVGRGLDWLERLESGRRESSLFMSTVQLWAQAVGLRLDVRVAGWKDADWSAFPDAATFWQVSRRWDADLMWLRLWVPAAAKAWREDRGVSAEVLGKVLGCSGSAVTHWERVATDPMLFKAFAHWRGLGTEMDLLLFDRESWEVENEGFGIR